MNVSKGAVKKNVDLHIHTIYSDGVWTVEQVLKEAANVGLKSISITDHDSVDAYPEAFELGRDLGIEVITGCEFSCEIDGVDVHILAYYIDVNNLALNTKLKEIKEARVIRAEKIVKNLNKQGIDLRFDTVLKIAGEGAIGRPHIANAMLQEELIYSFKEAFDKYIGYDSPAYVEKLKMTPEEVFNLIHDAGGVAILAHPGVTSVDEKIPGFVKDGLAGIELYHSEHNAALKRYYRDFCRKNRLIYTGGSDFHGHAQSRAQIGIPRVPYSVVEKLDEYQERFHRGEL